MLFAQVGSHLDFLLEVEGGEVRVPRRKAEEKVSLGVSHYSALSPSGPAHETV